MRSVYIITKPLQYINATNIPDDNLKDCYIMNSFYGAEEFTKYISLNSNRWSCVQFIAKASYFMRYYIFLKIIFKRARYTHLYTDFDYGTIHTFLFTFLRNLNIYTYEEGFGSYRQYVDKNSFSTWVKKKIGSQNWIGGNRFSKGGYFYYPTAMHKIIPKSKKKEILPFSKSFFEHVNTLKEIEYFIKNIDFDRYRNKSVLIYFTTWAINPRYKDIVDRYNGYYKILKPHPHIREDIDESKYFDEVVNIVPAEIFLMKLAAVTTDIVVIHEDSTSLIYLLSEGILNFKEINLKYSPNSEYSLIRNTILQPNNK